MGRDSREGRGLPALPPELQGLGGTAAMEHAAVTMPPREIRARIWQLEEEKNEAVARADYPAASRCGKQVLQLQRRRQNQTNGTPDNGRLPYNNSNSNAPMAMASSCVCSPRAHAQTPLIPLQDDDATATAARGEESGFFGAGMFKMPNIELPRVAMGFGGMFSDDHEDVQQKDHAADDPPESSSFFGTIASFRPFAAEEEASLQPPPKATSCGEKKKKKPKKREEEVEEYGGPATAQGLLANGGTKQIADYLAKNPDQAPRIQKELSNVSLLGNSMMVREEEDRSMYTTTTIAPPPPRPERVVACLACTRCVSANVTAPELLQQGGSNAVARYLEANPEKASKIQREMIDMPPLSPKGASVKASQLTKIFYGEM
jgi:hypothetical protein